MWAQNKPLLWKSHPIQGSRGSSLQLSNSIFLFQKCANNSCVPYVLSPPFSSLHEELEELPTDILFPKPAANWKCRLKMQTGNQGTQKIPSSCELRFPYPSRNLPAHCYRRTYCGNGSAHTNNSKIIRIQELVSIQIDARSSCCQWGKFQGP